MRESGDRDADQAERAPEIGFIDLAQLGAADPERAVAVRDSADPAAEDSSDEDYGPGWLGAVLRWPVRIVAVVVIAPVQVAWESLKAVGHGLRKAASALGRPFRAFGRGLKWVVARVLWWPLRWVYESALKPIGRGLAAVGRRVGDGLDWVGWQVYRWVLHPIGVAARAVGRIVGRGLHYLARPVVVLGRGVWHVLKVLGHWIAGLVEVLVDAFDVAARVGAKIGRGVVWLWTHSLWVPIRFAGKGFWDAAKWVGRGLRAIAQPVARRLRAVRTWYRREITEPVQAALRAARRDIRRALFGRGRG